MTALPRSVKSDHRSASARRIIMAPRRQPPHPSYFLALALILGVVYFVAQWTTPTQTTRPAPEAAPAGPGEYLFCFWNVENFFDDQDDRRSGVDEEYDDWFARDAAARQAKLDHLTQALLALNGGKGPDILAICEVESVRAAELLQQALNRQLPDGVPPYRNLLMKEVSAGRHIAPAILTRLPVDASRTQLYNKQLRILEGHIVVDEHELVVIASHWTSRVSDATGERRAKYGDQIYGAAKAMIRNNPDVDLLVCGDCNDPPDAPSITHHLHAVGDTTAVQRSGSEPLLFNLMANKDATAFGTLFYANRWSTFDQIFVAPGLLDGDGWNCDIDSVRVVNGLARPGDPKHRPWRFGNAKDHGERGYSDHFPVTVRLSVR
jgi:endonuclease/exonuclease/phosphatase family metal-dependent hydrolase